MRAGPLHCPAPAPLPHTKQPPVMPHLKELYQRSSGAANQKSNRAKPTDGLGAESELVAD